MRNKNFSLRSVVVLLAFAGYVGFVFLALWYLSHTLRVESAQSVTHSPTVETQETLPEVNFLDYSEVLNKQDYESTIVGGLSGLTYDPSRDLYYSLADRGVGNASARFYTLRLPLDESGVADPSILGVTTLRDPQGQSFTGSNFDGEGITVTSEGDLLIASETEPSIIRFSIEGDFLARLPVPQKFLVEPEGTALPNGTFESLSVSPDGSSLFTANELPLTSDGGSSEGEQRIRLLRYEDRGPTGFEPSQMFSYPLGPAQAVNGIEALSENELLVIEGRQRIFWVSLNEDQYIAGDDSLTSSDLPPVEKELLVDIANCLPSSDAQNLPANFEGIALGPELPSGRRALILQSDDNFSDQQKTGLIALGLQLEDRGPLKKGWECDRLAEK